MFYEEPPDDIDALELARRIWRRRILGALSMVIAGAAVLLYGWRSALIGKVSGLLVVPLAISGLVSLGLVAGLVFPPLHSMKKLATRVRDSRRQGVPLRARSWVWVWLTFAGSALLASAAISAMMLLRP